MSAPRLCSVTAVLESPALVDGWWPVPLDGLLLVAAPMADVPVDGHAHFGVRLPLARWQRGLNKQWVWAVSCAAIDAPADRSRRSHVLHDGPLRWTAAGDPPAILAMLETLENIGDEWRSGRGRVASWSVQDRGPFGPADLTSVMWRSDGLISRPLPARAATVLGLDSATVDTVPGAVRPPYSIAPLTAVGTREWRSVLAPWTRRLDG